MTLRRLPGDRPVDLHPNLTVLTGAGGERERWLERIRAAVETEANGSFLPPVVLSPADLPGARMTAGSAGPSQASQRVEAARRAVEAAQAAEDAARAELARLEDVRAEPSTGGSGLAEAEARFAAAQAAAELAGEELASTALEAEQETAAARATFEEVVADRRRRVEELGERRAGLQARRAELEAVLAEGEPPDTADLEAALARLDEQTSASTTPSPEAVALADRWADAQRRLADAPGAEPPAWLLVPAEEALTRAREALRHAEHSAGARALDPAAADRVEEAHRRVLDAEQRMMDRPGMLSKRKVDAALEAEREALDAIGVRSYNDYLQIVASRDSDDAERRIASARAAVTDAEAVWEELHRPLPTPERTAIEAELSALRSEARAVLGGDIADDEIEQALRGASRGGQGGDAAALVADALRHLGVDTGDDPVATARALVRDASTLRRRREDAETGMSAAARESAWVDKTAAELAADLQAEEPKPSEEVAARLAEVRSRSAAANDELSAAEQGLQLARERAALTESAVDALAAAQARVTEAAVARERAEAELRRLEEEEAQEVDAPVGPAEVADLRNVVPLEAELFVLGRLASMRAAGKAGTPAPLVLDEGFSGLSDDARSRL
ncbi:MAG: hypothetical protein ACLGHT_02045, partial [Acidimicrobiia bacterium]